MRRVLPPGRTTATLAIGWGQSILPFREDRRLAVDVPAQDASIELRTGLGNDRDLSVSLIARRTSPRLSFAGGGVAQIGRETGLAAVSATISQTFRPRRTFTPQGWAGVTLGGAFRPESLHAGLALNRQIGRFGVSGALETQVLLRGGPHIVWTPRVATNFSVSEAATIDFSVAAAREHDRWSPEISGGISQRLGRKFLLSASYSQAFLPAGGHARRAQVALTYVFPKLLRDK